MKHSAVFTHNAACAVDSARQPIAFARFVDTFQHTCVCLLAVLPLYRLRAKPLLNSNSDFIKATLEIFGKTVENFQFLIGDNENTNEAVDLLRVPFIGCASHRMNLAVNGYLNPFEPLLEKIHGLMKKL